MNREVSEQLTSFRYPTLALDVQFSVTHAIVVADKIWSETRVASFGGGGYIHQGTGQISAPTITSFVSTNREIWLRTRGGIETSIRAGENVKVNTGNDVAIIYSGPPGAKLPIALVNRTTCYWHTIQGSFGSIFAQYYQMPVVKKAGLLSYLLYLLCFCVLFSLTHGNEMANDLHRYILDLGFEISPRLSIPITSC